MVNDGSTPETAMPVREVSQKIAGWINRLGTIWVMGQVVEQRRTRNWVYLTLRDPLAEMSLKVTFNATVLEISGPIPDGGTLAVEAKPMFWTKSGELHLNALQYVSVGEGRLLAQLEQRKRALQAEGLFDPSRKKRPPFMPRLIGVITGRDTAAERDVYENVRRRWSGARLLTQPAAMQGPNCVPEVVAALQILDQHPDVDVIIIARGGGSLEDLLPFSDETLIRAVAACHTPVVSAIGHDIDTPHLDLVADVPASTPTDAAKYVVPDEVTERAVVREAVVRMGRAVVKQVEQRQIELDRLRSRPVLENPSAVIALHAERLANVRACLNRAVDEHLRTEQRDVEHALARITAMSPKATLERGYAILSDNVGGPVTAAGAEPGEIVKAVVLDGELYLEITHTEPKERS